MPFREMQVVFYALEQQKTYKAYGSSEPLNNSYNNRLVHDVMHLDETLL